MKAYYIYFNNGFRYMGLDLFRCHVVIAAEQFSDVINIIQKRMSKKGHNAVNEIHSIIPMVFDLGYSEATLQIRDQALKTPGVIFVTSFE